jgi:hypothetical protein
MTDSGLSTRLRQQSRRAGLMVGITMVLTMAICIFGAAALFAWLSRPFSDLIPVMAPVVNEAPAEPTARESAQAAPPPSNVIVQQEQPTPPPALAAAAAAPASASPEAFTPTHQIGASQSVNFRSGPTRSDPIIVALSPATPLQYLGEDQPTTNPEDGTRWMKFRIESGQEGWVREIDTEPYQP